MRNRGEKDSSPHTHTHADETENSQGSQICGHLAHLSRGVGEGLGGVEGDI